MPLFSFSKSNTNHDRIIADSNNISQEYQNNLKQFTNSVKQRQAIIDKTELYITQNNIRSQVLSAIR